MLVQKKYFTSLSYPEYLAVWLLAAEWKLEQDIRVRWMSGFNGERI